jgi:hypothetical protein
MSRFRTFKLLLNKDSLVSEFVANHEVDLTPTDVQASRYWKNPGRKNKACLFVCLDGTKGILKYKNQQKVTELVKKLSRYKIGLMIEPDYDLSDNNLVKIGKTCNNTNSASDDSDIISRTEPTRHTSSSSVLMDESTHLYLLNETKGIYEPPFRPEVFASNEDEDSNQSHSVDIDFYTSKLIEKCQNFSTSTFIMQFIFTLSLGQFKWIQGLAENFRDDLIEDLRECYSISCHPWIIHYTKNSMSDHIDHLALDFEVMSDKNLLRGDVNGTLMTESYINIHAYKMLCIAAKRHNFPISSNGLTFKLSDKLMVNLMPTIAYTNLTPFIKSLVEDIKTNTAKDIASDKNCFILPICGNSHFWVLVFSIDLECKKFSYFAIDSLSSNSGLSSTIASSLKDELDRNNLCPFLLKGFCLENMHQKDAFSCGFFAIRNIQVLLDFDIHNWEQFLDIQRKDNIVISTPQINIDYKLKLHIQAKFFQYITKKYYVPPKQPRTKDLSKANIEPSSYIVIEDDINADTQNKSSNK